MGDSEEIKMHKKNFYGKQIEIIEINGEYYFTAKTIADILKYGGKRPEKNIHDLIRNHRDEIEDLTVDRYLPSTDEKRYDTTLYHERAFYKICMWSNKPNAAEYRDRVSRFMQQLRKEGVVSVRDDVIILQKTGDPILDRINIHKTYIAILEEQYQTRQRLAKLENGQKKLERQIEENLPLTDEQIYLIREGIQEVYETKGISLWKSLRKRFLFSKLERVPRFKFDQIMKAINEVLGQKQLPDF